MMSIVRSSSRGVTLMELMVALTIFALVMSSLFMSFRTGIKAYEVGLKHADGTQSTRFIVNQVATDLRNVFYKTPSTYNVSRRQREALRSERERNALRSGQSRQDIQEDETLPDLGPEIDLAFRSMDNGEMDSLTFVRHQGEKIGRDRQPWGLARIHYYVSEGALWRAIEDCTAAPQDEYGNDLAKANPPQIDKLSENVTGFDLKFGYYGEQPDQPDWQTADDWDSDATRYRNPLDEELDPMDSASPENVTANVNAQPGQAASPGQPAGSAPQNQPDDLPAWVELTFRFSDPTSKKKGSDELREVEYKQIVQIPASQETYVPPDPQQDKSKSRRSRSARTAQAGAR